MNIPRQPVMAAVIVLFLAVLTTASWHAAKPAPRPLKATKQTPPAPSAPDAPPSGAPSRPAQPALAATPAETLETSAEERILLDIEDAATSYDAAQIPRIAPFLRHADAGIRDAAVQGLITLGDPAAAPVLRAAAKQISASDIKAAVPLLEAADYLELPPASLTGNR